MRSGTVIIAEPSWNATRPDPAAWLDEHGGYLFRFAMIRLRDRALAEDAVQATLLAALERCDSFSARSSERTWLVGILKHKIIDTFRRTSRDVALEAFEASASGDEYFRDAGDWTGHWRPSRAPTDWTSTPETAMERSEFWAVFDLCIDPLPTRTARAFTLREIDGLTTEEICEILDVTTSNLWVMLHRARLRLRRCIELNWFRREAARA